MSGARVLIVEDNQMLAKIIGRALRREFGIEAEMVADGKSGLARASTSTYDVILSDIRMPEKDGSAMIADIRTGSGPNRRTPVVIVTGHHEQGEAVARQLDARYVGKPFTRQALVEALGDLLSMPG